jgi:hypothetical protein
LRISDPDDLRVFDPFMRVGLCDDLSGSRIDDSKLLVLALTGHKLTRGLPPDTLHFIAVILKKYFSSGTIVLS